MKNRMRVCVVSTRRDPEILSSEFFDFLKALDVPVTTLQSPCVPEYVEEALRRGTITQIEMRHVRTPGFWRRAVEQKKKPVAVAICIAHMRAIHQCLSQGLDPYVVVFEEDVEFTKAAETGFLSTAKALYEQQDTAMQLVWLTYATQNLAQLRQVAWAPVWWADPRSFFQVPTAQLLPRRAPRLGGAGRKSAHPAPGLREEARHGERGQLLGPPHGGPR